MIVATAGHVDHGKTSLVRALTGIDTDRLPEERARGMTIELGFAYVDALGMRIGFVDVPGHERLVHTMVVGASGIDVALLVVAADDGPMPQTREHLHILELLGVEHVIGVVTKMDRVDADHLARTVADTSGLLAAAGYAAPAIHCVCALDDRGLDALREQIAAVGEAKRAAQQSNDALFRYAVDRAFTIPGTGTVVTGYVHAGRCELGDALRLWPGDREVRVRGIRVEDREATAATTGQRVALALAGVGRDDCNRGAWVLDPNHAPATSRVIARAVSNGLLARRDWQRVHVHAASAHVLGRICSSALPDMADVYELRLDEPLPLIRGDRLVLRDEAARNTLGGAIVLDPAPPLRGTRRPNYSDRLALFAASSPTDALGDAEQRAMSVPVEAFRRAWNLPSDTLAALLRARQFVRFADGARAFALDAATSERYQRAVIAAVSAWHKANPHVRGMRSEQLRAILKEQMPAPLQTAIADALVQRGELQRAAGHYALPGHAPKLGPEDERLWTRLEPLLTATDRPPVVVDLARRLVVPLDSFELCLRRLAFAGHVVRVAENRIFAARHVEELMALARTLDADSGVGFAVAAFRDASRLGRNLAIDVLEHFDSTGFTVRRGDARIVSRVQRSR